MLKNNLALRISNKGDGFKRSVLSRKSGISEEVISQILKGNTKNPGVFTIAKLAAVLDCTIEELLQNNHKTSKTPSLPIEKKEWNPTLFKDCTQEIIKFLDQKNKKLDFNQALFIISETYLYFLGKNSNKVDKEFIAWFIEHSL
jgi:transcriptional regulator with XRE-family HTH domain